MFRRVLTKIFMFVVIGTVVFATGAGSINADEIVKAQVGIDIKANKTGKVEIGDCIFTIFNVSESKYNGIRKASEGYKLLCISMRVENNGVKEQQLTSAMMFKLIDSNKQQYNIVMPEGLNSINGIIPAKTAASGDVWFEVPQEEKLFRFNIYPTIAEQQADLISIYLTGTANTQGVKANEGINQSGKENMEGYTLGNEIVVDNLAFTLTGISTASVNASNTADKAYKFLNIEMTVKNNGVKEEQITSAMTFKLIDTSGRVYNICLPEKQGVNGVIKPKDEISGRLTFKIDTGEKSLMLEIKPWTYKPAKGIVDIGRLD